MVSVVVVRYPVDGSRRDYCSSSRHVACIPSLCQHYSMFAASRRGDYNADFEWPVVPRSRIRGWTQVPQFGSARTSRRSQLATDDVPSVIYTSEDGANSRSAGFASRLPEPIKFAVRISEPEGVYI